MLTDWLDLEPLLQARLSGIELDGKAVPVLLAADLAGVKVSMQRAPAIQVLFDHYRPTNTSANGLSVKTQQVWNVVPVVRNVATPVTGAAVRREAGPLCVAVLRRLQGWKPDAEHAALTLVSPSFRAGYLNGCGYFPFSFATEVVTKGDAQ